MNIDHEAWLVAEEGDSSIVRYPTVRTYPLTVPEPLGIVWHWTCGVGGRGFARGLARRAQTYRRGIDRPASWHVLIAKNGAIYQSAPFGVGTWHVGRPGTIAGQALGNINRATIGCELENAGRLRKIRDRFYCWPYWLNPDAPPYERRPDPRCAVHTSRAVAAVEDDAFDVFPPEQEKAVSKLLAALVERYEWSRGACIYGHRDFDSPRKEDPGPLWSDIVLPRVLDAVFGPSTVTVLKTEASARAKGA